MPRDVLERYTAIEIAELMAYYRIKEQDRKIEAQLQDIEQQRTGRTTKRRRIR